MNVTIKANVCDRCEAKALRQEKGACVWFKGARVMAGCSSYVIARHDGEKSVLHLCALCTAEQMQSSGLG